ncbi:MAG: hypothetical protein ACUVX8_04005 [Candidatus Zipacnadales bacterium]
MDVTLTAKPRELWHLPLDHGQNGRQCQRCRRLFWARSAYTVVLLAAASVSAQRSASLQPSISPSTVTVGDWLTYTVEVPLKPSERVIGPGADADFGPWEVRGYKVQTTNTGASIVYNLAAFETGELEIPSIEITLSDMQGHQRALKTMPLRVTVASVLKGPQDVTPADIVAPLSLREQPLAIVLRVLLLLLVIALLATGVWLIRSRLARRAAEAQRESAPPDIAALKALKALREARLPEAGKGGQHYAQLSEIVRTYLTARYGILALQENTFRIVSEMQNQRNTVAYAPIVHDLLFEADLVRFAKAEPDLKDCYAAVETAERLVRETASPFASIEQTTP